MNEQINLSESNTKIRYPLGYLVPGAGVEPASAEANDILSVACMPFHHPGMNNQKLSHISKF